MLHVWHTRPLLSTLRCVTMATRNPNHIIIPNQESNNMSCWVLTPPGDPHTWLLIHGKDLSAIGQSWLTVPTSITFMSHNLSHVKWSHFTTLWGTHMGINAATRPRVCRIQLDHPLTGDGLLKEKSVHFKNKRSPRQGCVQSYNHVQKKKKDFQKCP